MSTHTSTSSPLEREQTALPAAQHPRPGRRWFPWVAALLGIALAWITGEIALRLLGLAAGNGVFVNHPVFHHWQEPNFRQLVTHREGEFGGFTAYFNADGMGMREPLPPTETPSLMFLGDSFTLGREVPEEQRFVTLVGKELGIPALNFGCASFCPLLERLALEEFSNRVSPRVIVLTLYANDLDDEQRMWKRARKDASGAVLAVPGEAVPAWTRLTRRSYVLQNVRALWLQREATQAMQRRNAGQWGGDAWSPFFERPIRETFSSEELDRFESSIRAIAAHAAERGAGMVLTAVPDRGSLVGSHPDHFCDYVSELAAREKIRLVDLREALRGHDPQELFFPTDIHFTAAGHAIVAKALSQAIREILAAKATE